VAVLLVYLGCAAAAWKLRQTTAGELDGIRVPGGQFAPLLATIAIVYLLSTVTIREWMVVAGVVAVASVLYFVSRREMSLSTES
jgi:Ni/Fe-hydrogenase subunit HybB-like protein